MSSRIIICPGCNAIAALMELPELTLRELLVSLTGDNGLSPNWKAWAHWCAACDTAVITAWPANIPKGQRREMVGLPADLVEIDEERGQP